MKRTILVIDDNLFHAEVVRALLENDGLRVVITADAKSGVDAAHRERPSAVILDFSMPGGDGDRVLAALRQSRETEHIPVLFLTAHKDVERLVGVHRNVAFLRKEDGITPVRAAVQGALRRAELRWP